jgi:hypothetical protein
MEFGEGRLRYRMVLISGFLGSVAVMVMWLLLGMEASGASARRANAAIGP